MRRSRIESHTAFALAAIVLATGALHAQEQQIVDWEFQASDFRGQTGKTFNVYCPPGGTRSGSVWGSGVYTDDSVICVAAVHALATFDPVRGGTVYFSIEPGQEGYESDRRRGVQSQTWGVWQGGVRILAGVPGKRHSEISDTTAIEVTWATPARHFRGEGAQRVVLCPRDGNVQPVWGNKTYADDSSICTAAVHAGRITFDDGGAVTLRLEPGREGYSASTRNGVNSLAWEKWDGSFTFPRRQVRAALPAPVDDPAPAPDARMSIAVPLSPPPPPAPQPTGEFLVDWRTNGVAWRGEPGRALTVVCPPGGTAGSIWGAGEYTDDSSLCTAAVHALATFSVERGGTVYITTTPGRATYADELRRDIMSSSYGEWQHSFRVVGGVPGRKPVEIADTTITEISWSATAHDVRGTASARLVLCPTHAQSFPVWGSDVYTDHSSICGAAVHAGLITRDAGGRVTVRFESGRDQYRGSAQNEVTTQALGAWSGSFSFVR